MCLYTQCRWTIFPCQCLKIMMTSSSGNIFRVTGPLCGEFTGQRWIPLTKASDAELWYFLWSAPEESTNVACGLNKMCLYTKAAERYFPVSVWKWWWRHRVVTFSVLLALCAGNSPVNGEFPLQRPVTRSFDIFFDLRLNKRLSKRSWGWWFEMPSCLLWCHCNVMWKFMLLAATLWRYDMETLSHRWAFVRGITPVTIIYIFINHQTPICFTLFKSSVHVMAYICIT